MKKFVFALVVVFMIVGCRQKDIDSKSPSNQAKQQEKVKSRELSAEERKVFAEEAEELFLSVMRYKIIIEACGPDNRYLMFIHPIFASQDTRDKFYDNQLRYGMSSELKDMNFYKRAGFTRVYLSDAKSSWWYEVEAVTLTAEEEKEKQAIREEMERAKELDKKSGKKATEKGADNGATLRKQCAIEMEKIYLKDNLPVVVNVLGPENRHIVFVSFTFVSPDVRNGFARGCIENEILKKLGFTRIYLSDGESSWLYDL